MEKVNSHTNAKLTAKCREEMIRWMHTAPAAEVATDFVVSIRTARKWMSRYRHGGECLSHVSVAEDAYDNSAFAAAACCAPYASLLAPGLPPWRRNCLLSAIKGKCRDKCCIWISSGLERLMGLGTEK